MTDGNMNEATGVRTAEAQPGSGAASGSASVILAEAYHRHKAALEMIEKICRSTKHKNQIADILREIERAKAK